MTRRTMTITKLSSILPFHNYNLKPNWMMMMTKMRDEDEDVEVAEDKDDNEEDDKEEDDDNYQNIKCLTFSEL